MRPILPHDPQRGQDVPRLISNLSLWGSSLIESSGDFSTLWWGQLAIGWVEERAGNRLSECAVFGEPSGSSMLSQLPWSAVTTQAPPSRAAPALIARIGYGRGMVFDFRHKNAEGKWRSSGFRKGITRDAAFASLEQKNGPMPPGRYMSRPRDGRTKNWDLFTRP